MKEKDKLIRGEIMDLFVWVLLALIADSLIGLSGAVVLLLQNEKKIKFLSFLLVAFAAGALLGGGFLHLIPEAVESLEDVFLVFVLVLVGFVIFLVLEVALHWHSCEECKIHPFSYLVLLGDALHNIIDGIIIATAFLVSIPVGVITTMAIILHEIPQELGIFGVQVYSGIKKTTALRNSFIAQLSCVMGGLAAYFYIGAVQGLSYYILPFAAGGFIYIAASDLIPELHKENKEKKILGFAVFFLGLLFMYLLHLVEL